MPVSRTKLSTFEHKWCQSGGLCFYCSRTKHLVSQCPECPPPQTIQPAQKWISSSHRSKRMSPIEFISYPVFTIKVQIRHSEGFAVISALIESVAEGNIIDWALVENSALIPNHSSLHTKYKPSMEDELEMALSCTVPKPFNYKSAPSTKNIQYIPHHHHNYQLPHHPHFFLDAHLQPTDLMGGEINDPLFPSLSCWLPQNPTASRCIHLCWGSPTFHSGGYSYLLPWVPGHVY